ncbi:MAG: hypothetical protein ACLR9Z_10765 [Alitiscatomonas sp.]
MEERKKKPYHPCTGEHDFCTRGLPPPAGEGMRRPGRPACGQLKSRKIKMKKKIKKSVDIFPFISYTVKVASE